MNDEAPRNPLGRFARLPIVRFGSPGAFLALDDDRRPGAPVVLLPGGEIPEGAKEGDELSVFIYLDSEHRPVATLVAPILELGEVGFLEVTDVTGHGAFVAWGMPKDLLVPIAEQTTPMHKGERYAVGVVIDRTGRLGATMRVAEMLRERGKFANDEWVHGEAWRNDPGVGVFVIVEKRYLGLVHRNEPHSLSRGESARFRIATVLPDGKLELTLRAHAFEEQASDAKKILDVLVKLDEKTRVSDKSSPDDVRRLFALSKKAFKRGVGALLKQRAIDIDANGTIRLAKKR
ncbi:S1 RNA-binding domain-containing protein [soil metagenome]